MTHEDKGHYADKHTNKSPDPALSVKIRQLSKENCITCAAAHKAAGTSNVSPAAIGRQIDLLEYRIIECQMGLFGSTDGEKHLDSDIDVNPSLDKELDAKQTDRRISCRDCWDIAAKIKVKRIDVGSACEKKQIRIKPCQLGAY